MTTVAISVPSGAHHRSFLQPMRDLFVEQTDWRFLIITPGAPWSDQLFPFADYPRERFSFVENDAAEGVLAEIRPTLGVTTTTGLDPVDPPILETAKKLGLRTATVIESWDKVF